MATAPKLPDYRMKTPVRPPTLELWYGVQHISRVTVVMFLLCALTFISTLYYVEQQLRLRSLNYAIIDLKQRKQELIEQQKTLQLQLDQAKQLDKIEAEMQKRGFVPVQETQIRLIQ
jgi:hypothetical protein